MILEPGWIDPNLIDRLLQEHEVVFVKNGERHNYTDGETHKFYRKADKTFELKANCYDSQSYQSFIDWIEST